MVRGLGVEGWGEVQQHQPPVVVVCVCECVCRLLSVLKKSDALTSGELWGGGGEEEIEEKNELEQEKWEGVGCL